VQGLEATASSSAALAARARASRMGVAGYGGGVAARELRAVNEVAARETSVFGDPLAQRFELTPGHPRDPHAVFSEHSHTMVDFVHGTYRLEWPNSLLLPERSIGKLADAQRSILRVRHARLALQEAHDRVHEAGHVDASSLGHRGGGERGRAGPRARPPPPPKALAPRRRVWPLYERDRVARRRGGARRRGRFFKRLPPHTAHERTETHRPVRAPGRHRVVRDGCVRRVSSLEPGRPAAFLGGSGASARA
jgi:hypothetical protein